MTDFDYSATIRKRLEAVLRNISHEQALLRHIEAITMCSFPMEGLKLDRLIEQIGNKPEAVSSVKGGYRVWKTIRTEDRLSILQCFLLIFSEQTAAFSAGQKIELFCRLFFRHFIPVLEEYDKLKLSDGPDSESD
jgi:hypothetical protein